MFAGCDNSKAHHGWRVTYRDTGASAPVETRSVPRRRGFLTTVLEGWESPGECYE